jgi:hypothetical protein
MIKVWCCAFLAACGGRAASPRDDAASAPVPPPPVAMHPADAAIDAPPAIDAMQFAIFDHVAIHDMKTQGRAKLGWPAGAAKRPPKIAATPSDKEHPVIEFPPWMQQSIGRVPIVVAHVEADGSAIVTSNTGVVALVDADHRVEYGLDLAHTEPAFRVEDAHRVGSIVIVAATDPNDAMSFDYPEHFLVAIDATTGTFAWRSERGTTSPRFAMWGGYAITSVGHQIRAYAVDTGALAAAVNVKSGPFQLVTDATGIHGVPDSSQPVVPEHGIDLALE